MATLAFTGNATFPAVTTFASLYDVTTPSFVNTNNTVGLTSVGLSNGAAGSNSRFALFDVRQISSTLVSVNSVTFTSFPGGIQTEYAVISDVSFSLTFFPNDVFGAPETYASAAAALANLLGGDDSIRLGGALSAVWGDYGTFTATENKTFGSDRFFSTFNSAPVLAPGSLTLSAVGDAQTVNVGAGLTVTAGHDFMDFGYLNASSPATLIGDFQSVGGSGTVIWGNDSIFGGAGADVIHGDGPGAGTAGGDDSLYGGLGNDQLFGSGGNDRLTGGDGGDTLDGGQGFDLAAFEFNQLVVVADLVTGTSSEGDTFVSIEGLLGGFNSDTLSGDSAANFLSGNAGNDSLGGRGGNDVLIGGAGVDTLDGGAGADSMTGGTGDDLYFVDDLGDVVTELASEGTDTVRTALPLYVLPSNIENLELTSATSSQGDGNGLDNLITGSASDNLLRGLTGNDTINGGGGNDFIVGGAGADSMDGGGAFDSVSWQDMGGAVTVNLTNQALNAGQAAGDRALNFEAFYFTSFGDTFVNDAAGGYIYGFGGDDTITGGNGSEVIDAGAGADSVNAGLGFDYFSYANAAGGVRVDFSNPATNTGEAAGDQLTGIEAFYLSAHADIFIGQAGQNVVYGGNGADALFGGANASDWLFGEGGNDFLSGGSFNDLLSGGADADTYAFTSWVGNGFDSVLDFASGLDRIQLTGSGFSLAAGGLTAGFNFVSGAAPLATGARATLLYNTGNGILSFDLDGTGATFGSTPLAQFAGAPTLLASDFLVI